MAPLDATSELPDIDAAVPAGPNLEFDADFIELERLVQGKAEQQYGSLVVAAEEPDWKSVIAAATGLLARTYDLRVMVQLAVARLHTVGFGGYGVTLAMIRNLLETRWTIVHPLLDPDDDNDPTLRANSLLTLGEPGRVLQVMRTMPLARSTRAGSVSWQDIAICNGTMDADEGATKVTEATISAAFRETDAAALAMLRDAIASATQDATAIPAVFDRECGYGTGPELGELVKLLNDISRSIAKYTPTASESPEAEPIAAEQGGGEAAAVVSSGPRMAAASAASLTAVSNRSDAMRLLDLVVQYYEQHEPSSPLPLLIGRARRLAEMTFIDLLRDLAPDGVSQAETIVGRPPE